jgi:hypothetical protein
MNEMRCFMLVSFAVYAGAVLMNATPRFILVSWAVFAVGGILWQFLRPGHRLRGRGWSIGEFGSSSSDGGSSGDCSWTGSSDSGSSSSDSGSSSCSS